jgi:hypothetical protein
LRLFPESRIWLKATPKDVSNGNKIVTLFQTKFLERGFPVEGKEKTGRFPHGNLPVMQAQPKE